MQIEETVEVNQREDTTPPPSEPAEEKPVQNNISEEKETDNSNQTQTINNTQTVNLTTEGKSHPTLKKTFLGRDADSWFKITSFYFAFYAVLAGIFAAFVLGFSSNCPDTLPYLHGRALQGPGLSYIPNLDYKNYDDWINQKHADIDKSVAFVFKSGTTEYTNYEEKANKFFEKHEGSDFSHLGDCMAKPYGFDTDKPCLFFKLNRVIDWEPAGVFPQDILNFFGDVGTVSSLSDTPFCEGKPEWCKDNQDKIKELTDSIDMTTVGMDSKKPIVRCLQYSDTTKVPMTLFPADGKINFKEPFYGESQKGTAVKYENQLVAIQFDLTAAMDEDHRFYCFAFDRNVQIDYKTFARGTVSLYMKITPA